MSKANSLRCPLCGKGRIADIPSGAEQSQYRLFALHRAEHPDLIAKCPKCGEQIGITVLTPDAHPLICLLYTSPSPRDKRQSRMPSSA